MNFKRTLALIALATVWVTVASLVAQNAPAPAAPQRFSQGGSGPIRVLFFSKGHDFDREGLMTMLDQLGGSITWTHVEHPAAQVFYDPANSKGYDAYLFYDAPSRGAPTPQPPNGVPGYHDPGPMAKKNFAALTQSGMGLV